MDTAMVMVTAMDMATEAMDTATMARGLLMLRLPLLPSPAMDMVTDTAMVMVTAMDMAMEAMAMDTMATTARGPLMLLPVMATMAIMDMAAMDTTDTVTDMAMATTDKFLLLF